MVPNLTEGMGEVYPWLIVKPGSKFDQFQLWYLVLLYGKQALLWNKRFSKWNDSWTYISEIGFVPYGTSWGGPNYKAYQCVNDLSATLYTH